MVSLDLNFTSSVAIHQAMINDQCGKMGTALAGEICA